MQIENNTALSACSPESMFPPLPPSDDTHKIIRGLTAGLENLRSYIPSSNKDGGQTSTVLEKGQTFDGIDDSTGQEKMLYHLPSLRVTFQKPQKLELSPPQATFQNVKGQVFVTSRRLFFITSSDSESENDLSIDSSSIFLHAMTCEPEIGVYCQLAAHTRVDGMQVGNEETGEIHFFPMNDVAEDKRRELCQGLFDSLSLLTNLNPVCNEDGVGSDLVAMMDMMTAVYGENQTSLEGVEDGEDIVCRIDPKHMVTPVDNYIDSQRNDQSNDGATEAERLAMLERLDNVLVVPPEYRVTRNEDEDMNEGVAEGQFDDAEEEVCDAFL